MGITTQGVKESELRTSKVTFLKFRFDGWVDDDSCIVSNETRYTEKRSVFCQVEKASSC